MKNFSTGVAAIAVEEGANCEFSTLNVHHNQGGGFFLNQSNNVVMQTQIHDNAGVGITVWNTANTLIYNNIIFDNAPVGAIAVTSYANGTMIINNTLRGSLNNYGVGTIIKDNTVQQGRINDFGTGTTMANNITENLPSN